MAVGPYSQDVLTRMVNVQWGKVEQQGLVAEYTKTSEGDFNSQPTAYALDTGDTFSGVNMGASGLNYTVLTGGLVCFGKPRDGDSCFMICTEYNLVSKVRTGTINRGTVNESGDLTWGPVGGGTGLAALTFAGEAFHAVYVEDDGATRIETSFDGSRWSSATAFPRPVIGGSGGIIGGSGGTVAFSGDRKDDSGAIIKHGSYAATGYVDITTPEDYFLGNILGLSWAAANKGGLSLGWSSGAVANVDDNPGSRAQFAGSVHATITAGGKETFVAAAFSKKKSTIKRPGEPDENRVWNVILETAAVAVSSDGNAWETIRLPGVVEGAQDALTGAASSAIAVAFIRTSARNGYFLSTATNFPAEGASYSTLHRSEDGWNWSSEIRRSSGFFFTLSAIAKDPGRVVRF